MLSFQGTTPSSGTGPQRAYGGDYYFYFEATNRDVDGYYYFFDKDVWFEGKQLRISVQFTPRLQE
jgi:hypothetical protein